MAKSKKSQKAASQATNKPVVHSQKQAEKIASKPKEPGFALKYQNELIAAAIAVLVFLFLKICLNNQFTNWDDPGYVRDNPLIKNISSEGLKNIFSTAVMGNYHPLTILSYALEYSTVRLEPFRYHLDSLLLHIAVTISVFYFILLLFRKQHLAILIALLFGLHPMHMESVAWIAARKDVMYGLFYMLSCIFYLKYIKSENKGKWTFYAFSLLLFICSLFSKPVAVVLPVSLFLIDFLEQRKLYPSQKIEQSESIDYKPFSYGIYIEKILFFAFSLAFGYKSLLDQHEFKALNTMDVSFTAIERISLGCYALVMYLIKSIVPYGLSNFYPYPNKVDNALPILYLLYPLIVIILAVLIFIFFKKKRALLFGILFFLINIVLLLQFIPVGGAILADRYTYIPYLGLFILMAIPISSYYEKFQKQMQGKIILVVITAYVAFLGLQSNARCQVWYDTISLWKDEVVKHPDAPNAFNNLGFEYFTKGNESVDPRIKNSCFDSATIYLKEAIRLQPTFVNPYISLGEVARSRGIFPEAKTYYYKALSLNKDDQTHNAYLGLAIIYCITGQQAAQSKINPAPYYDSAKFCFQNALRLKPFFAEAHSNYGNFFDMMGNFDSSYRQYTLAIEQNPDMYAPYLNRGRLMERHNKCGEAFKDFQKALDISPEMGEIYYSRSFCHRRNGNKKLALQDVEKARALGFLQIDPAYYTDLKTP